MFAQVGHGDWLSTLLWFGMFIVFITLYPRLMISQIVWKLERETAVLESWDRKAASIATRAMRRTKPDQQLRMAVRNFLDFFMITPVDLDPYGIIKKLDSVIRDQRSHFRSFVGKWSDKKDPNLTANLEAGLGGAITVHQIAKLVRHYVELIKRYKNLQIAMLLQMQLPMIKDISKAALNGTESFCNGDPVGDGIAPYVIADMIGDRKLERFEELEIVYVRKKINNKDVILVKAAGPGARIGYPGKALSKLINKYNPDRIITIDAGAKLEGEKTGAVAEGVGVAMGGFGVERYAIEEIACKRKIPVDAIIIKMRPEQAIAPMPSAVLRAAPRVKDVVQKCLAKVKKRAIVLGVGNTCGIGNNKASLADAQLRIKRNIRRAKLAARREEKKRGIFGKLFKSL